MFKKILIANRGEIACRVIKTARSMGVATVAVYSEADANARHVRLADEAVLIGPPAARESYLVADRILDAAKDTGREAVHPGYGFLSENERLRRGLRAGRHRLHRPAGLGDPRDGLEVGRQGADGEGPGAADAGLPRRQPGRRVSSPSRPTRIGYPVLIKASAGGGGKGMRRVDEPADFEAALRLVQARGHQCLRRRPRAGREVRAASRATSRSRCSATRTATASTCSSATARCSAATRRCSRKRPHRA